MADTNDSNLPEFITARELIPFIRRKTGLPFTNGALKLEVARGTGPRVVGKWGNCRLFGPHEALEWALTRVKASATKEQRRPRRAKQPSTI